ncbi:hypothetical protein BDV3_006980 [Batrachochytrium dendrobatidis]
MTDESAAVEQTPLDETTIELISSNRAIPENHPGLDVCNARSSSNTKDLMDLGSYQPAAICLAAVQNDHDCLNKTRSSLSLNVPFPVSIFRNKCESKPTSHQVVGVNHHQQYIDSSKPCLVPGCTSDQPLSLFPQYVAASLILATTTWILAAIAQSGRHRHRSMRPYSVTVFMIISGLPMMIATMLTAIVSALLSLIARWILPLLFSSRVPNNSTAKSSIHSLVRRRSSHHTLRRKKHLSSTSIHSVDHHFPNPLDRIHGHHSSCPNHIALPSSGSDYNSLANMSDLTPATVAAVDSCQDYPLLTALAVPATHLNSNLYSATCTTRAKSALDQQCMQNFVPSSTNNVDNMSDALGPVVDPADSKVLSPLVLRFIQPQQFPSKSKPQSISNEQRKLHQNGTRYTNSAVASLECLPKIHGTDKQLPTSALDAQFNLAATPKDLHSYTHTTQPIASQLLSHSSRLVPVSIPNLPQPPNTSAEMSNTATFDIHTQNDKQAQYDRSNHSLPHTTFSASKHSLNHHRSDSTTASANSTRNRLGHTLLPESPSPLNSHTASLKSIPHGRSSKLCFDSLTKDCQPPPTTNHLLYAKHACKPKLDCNPTSLESSMSNHQPRIYSSHTATCPSAWSTPLAVHSDPNFSSTLSHVTPLSTPTKNYTNLQKAPVPQQNAFLKKHGIVLSNVVETDSFRDSTANVNPNTCMRSSTYNDAQYQNCSPSSVHPTAQSLTKAYTGHLRKSFIDNHIVPTTMMFSKRYMKNRHDFETNGALNTKSVADVPCIRDNPTVCSSIPRSSISNVSHLQHRRSHSALVLSPTKESCVDYEILYKSAYNSLFEKLLQSPFDELTSTSDVMSTSANMAHYPSPARTRALTAPIETSEFKQQRPHLFNLDKQPTHSFQTQLLHRGGSLDRLQDHHQQYYSVFSGLNVHLENGLNDANGCTSAPMHSLFDRSNDSIRNGLDLSFENNRFGQPSLQLSSQTGSFSDKISRVKRLLNAPSLFDRSFTASDKGHENRG